jgi:glycosyltransferase involved in cell wall biosynthesis
VRPFTIALGIAALHVLVEEIVLGPVPGPRSLARFLFRRRLRALEAVLDRDFYLRQVRFRTARAARDPALHYALLGRFKNLAPNPEFDPLHYRAAHPELRRMGDALWHHLDGTRDRVEATCEVAALPPLSPSAANGRGETVLTLHHARGGGSGRLLRIYEERLCEGGHTVLRLARVSPATPLYRPYDRRTGQPLAAPFALEGEEPLRDMCRELGVRRLVVNHVIDLAPQALRFVPAACAAAGIPFDVLLHDYYLLCPRVNLVDASRRYCGEPDVDVCRRCIARSGSEAGAVDPAAWRADAAALLRRADRVLAPSHDTAARFRRYWPELAIEVWRPEDDRALLHPLPPALAADGVLKIAVLGSLSVFKGFDVVRGVALEIARRRLPIRLSLVGESIGDAALRRAGVAIRGRYRESDAGAILRAEAPHIGWLPAVWPETWSFVLSEFLRLRLPVYAFDIGAVAERLRGLGQHTLMPFAMAARPDLVAERFLAVRAEAIARGCDLAAAA